jgi:hypothetical protein
MCVLIFSTTRVHKIYHFKKNSKNYHKFSDVFTSSISYSGQILTKLELLDIFSKIPVISDASPSDGSPLVPYEANSRSSQCLERASK